MASRTAQLPRMTLDSPGPRFHATYLRLSILFIFSICQAGCNLKSMLIPDEDPAPPARERMSISQESARAVDLLVSPPSKSPREKFTEKTEIESHVFSVAEAIGIALQNNPRLLVAAAALDQARGQEQVAFAPFLPELWLDTRYGASTPPLSPGAPGPVGAIIPTGTGSTTFAQAELDLQWTLWDFGRTAGRYGQAVSRERIAALQLVRLRQTVALDTTAAYLAVLLAQASSKVHDQAVKQGESVLADARSRLKGGVADKDDVLRAEVQLSEAREALVLARQSEYDSLARLNYAMGRNVSLPLQVIDWKARPRFERSLPECLELAAANRQEVAMARQAVAEARYSLQAASGEFLPKLYVRVGSGYVTGENVRNGWQEGAGIHLDQPLYGGGRRQGEKRAAEADIRHADAQAQALFDTISLEVNLAFRAVHAIADRIPLADTAVKQARENLRLVRAKYKNGNATPTDVVDAETANTRSEQRYYSSIYQYLDALARMEYALGTPAEVMLEQAPEEAPPARLLPPVSAPPRKDLP